MPQSPTKIALDWKYCECGCKGYDIKVGPLSFWVFWHIGGDNKFHLWTDHAANGEKIGSYDKRNMVTEAIIEIAKTKITQLKKQLVEIEKTIKIS